MSERKFDFVMIGSRAVGKTSLLSAMWQELSNRGKDVGNGMSLSPTTHDELKMLTDKWNAMGEKINASTFETDLPSVEGTMEVTTHSFTMKVKSHDDFQLNFFDMPGGWVADLKPEVKEIVKQAFGVFCVIDAAVLMEMDHCRNNKINMPSTIKQIFKEVIEDGNHSRKPNCCFFIPVKCEKYMKDEKGREALFNKFVDVYHESLCRYLIDNEIDLFYMPVQTTGCLEYSHLRPPKKADPQKADPKNSGEKEKLTELMVFLKEAMRDFQPVDAVAVLPLVLWKMLTNEAGFWDSLINLFGKSLRDFANDIKKNSPKPLDIHRYENGKWTEWTWWLTAQV